MKSGSTPVTSYFLFLLTILSILTGCSSVQHDVTPPLAVPPRPTAIDLRNSSVVKSTLLKHYREWHGTPYRMGGLDRRGIDCSGFTYITFRSKLGYILPRTTDLQAQTRRQVVRNNLRIGDLVFFKTNFYSNHVGIYLGDSEFLHASTSKGVIISSMKKQYWKYCYWTARRIDT